MMSKLLKYLETLCLYIAELRIVYISYLNAITYVFFFIDTLICKFHSKIYIIHLQG